MLRNSVMELSINLWRCGIGGGVKTSRYSVNRMKLLFYYIFSQLNISSTKKLIDWQLYLKNRVVFSLSNSNG